MNKISKLLVANRGEIAVRVMRTASKMGCKTVAVYSTADADALHVQCADQAIWIGESLANQSYLVAEKIIAAAKQSGADAIHPGYGFLSENADFAEACLAAGITFVGPPAEAIRLMGSKRLSKIAMLDSDVPCIPGYQGADQSDETLMVQAQEIGLPLMIKASAGGGGRGMRLVFGTSELQRELDSARREAQSAFGSDEVILERALIEPRHIEIQIFADTHGNVVHLGERDCSIQRRHQKVVEESPSPFVDQELRTQMGQAAVNAAKACSYVGAGTVEFLVDNDKSFYFLEMNTRLQVEHPVTELVTGQDLVAWQLRVAAGEPLPLQQSEIEYSGHAIEVRLYAEDPRQNFMPQTGTIKTWKPSTAEGIRTDGGIATDQQISPYYDPLLAKVVAWGENRNVATSRLSNALSNTVLLGVNNNKQFLRTLLELPDFQNSDVTTAFLQQQFPDLEYQLAEPQAQSLAIAAVLFYWRSASGRGYLKGNWSVAEPRMARLLLECEEQEFALQLCSRGDVYTVSYLQDTLEFVLDSECQSHGRCWLISGDSKIQVDFVFEQDQLYFDDGSGHYLVSDISYRPAAAADAIGNSELLAPMDGAIVELLVNNGDYVEAGQTIAVLEAMKMAHQLKAGVSGTVHSLAVQIGQQVTARHVVARIVEEK